MTGLRKTCPDCATTLLPSRRQELVAWECPNKHGVGIPLAEAYGYFQRDELAAIWAALKEATPSRLPSPIDGKPMLEVTFMTDPDPRARQENNTSVTIEVDKDNYFGWFESSELHAMPLDGGRGAKAPGLVGLDQMDDHHDAHHHIYSTFGPDDREFKHETGVSKLIARIVERLK